MTQLARLSSHRAGLALVQANDDIKVLDPLSGELRSSGPRVDAIGTVSLGYKRQNGYPAATQKGDARWLHPHDADDAPALLDALQAGNYRHLTISLASDEWGEIIQQHYAAYSMSALQVYGDDQALTYITRQKVIDPNTQEQAKDDKGKLIWEPMHITVSKADEPEMYARMLKICKVQTSIYFYLAEWADVDGNWIPQVVMDGDVGLYRLRTTGTHTVENLASTVKQIRGVTGGYIKGVPLTLSVSFPEVAGPDGKKRTVPVCTFRLQPPYRITGVNFRPMLEAAVNEGQALALPAPAVERIEDEERAQPLMPDAVTTDERELDLLTRGGRCPAARYTRIFFSMLKSVEGTAFDHETLRANLVREFSHGETDSLADLLRWSTDEEAQKFIAFVDERLNGPDDPEPERPSVRSDEYERLYDPSYQESAPIATPPPSIRQRQQTQPDGLVVDTVSGEVISEPLAQASGQLDGFDASTTNADEIEEPSDEIRDSDVQLAALGADLDTLINQTDEAPPEPPDDDERVLDLAAEHVDDSEHTGGAEPVPASTSIEMDYGRCLEIYQTQTHLTLAKPLARQKPEYYADWHAKYLEVMVESGELPF